MPNRTPAQVNDHVNVQVQVNFPVNIEAAFLAQATRTVAFLVKHRARAYVKHPMMLETISPGLAAAAPETVIAMAKQLIETERQAPRRWFGFGGEVPILNAKAVLLLRVPGAGWREREPCPWRAANERGLLLKHPKGSQHL